MVGGGYCIDGMDCTTVSEPSTPYQSSKDGRAHEPRTKYLLAEQLHNGYFLTVTCFYCLTPSALPSRFYLLVPFHMGLFSMEISVAISCQGYLRHCDFSYLCS